MYGPEGAIQEVDDYDDDDDRFSKWIYFLLILGHKWFADRMQYITFQVYYLYIQYNTIVVSLVPIIQRKRDS